MLLTSEQVSAGHPDKICDQISDAIVTDCLQHDKNSRVAVECMIKDYEIILAGELTSTHEPDFDALARRRLCLIGVPNFKDYHVTTHISKQSPDIAMGFDKSGAGDQGIVYGYATDETVERLPIAFVLATDALERLGNREYSFLLPDAKSQVTYDTKRNRIDSFLISTQHTEDAKQEELHHAVHSIMLKTAKRYQLNTDFKVLINPTGRFVLGGSFADTGVTGRKLICDTYGGACRHGGGAFSGKDPTKVDRSAAYMARRIAKDIVNQHFAHRCEVQLAYAIGMEQPVSVAVDTFHTGHVPSTYLVRWIRKHYDLSPSGIIEFLGLRDVDYNQVSAYGHFWRPWLPWER